jgi:hypothetical protein
LDLARLKMRLFGAELDLTDDLQPDVVGDTAASNQLAIDKGCLTQEFVAWIENQ